MSKEPQQSVPGKDKFIVGVVIDIEMTVQAAVHALSGPKPDDDVNEYLNRVHGAVEKVGAYNEQQIRKALGEYLAGVRISEARQLTLSTDSTREQMEAGHA